MSRLSILWCVCAPFVAWVLALEPLPISFVVLEGLLTGLGPNQDLRKDREEEDWGPDGVVDTPEEAATSLSDFFHVLYPFVLYVALALEDAIFAMFVPCIRDLLPPVWAFKKMCCEGVSSAFLAAVVFFWRRAPSAERNLQIYVRTSMVRTVSAEFNQAINREATPLCISTT